MAAVGSNSAIIGLLVNLFIGISLGTNVIIAHAIGRGDREEIHKAVHNSIIIALAGGFFWGGTRGATLSVGKDDALYLTERRAADELSTGDALDTCLEDFARSAQDWRERSRLYA